MSYKHADQNSYYTVKVKNHFPDIKMVNFGMSEKHREVLRKNRVFLVENIVPTYSLFNQLRADDVLSEEMIESILTRPTTRGKISALLDLLTRRGPNAFTNFISLCMINHDLLYY